MVTSHQAMEFRVTKPALLNELSATQGVVERNTTTAILSNLLVKAKGSPLTIAGTVRWSLGRTVGHPPILHWLLSNVQVFCTHYLGWVTRKCALKLAQTHQEGFL